MSMHRKNKCRGAKRGFDYNPVTGKYDKPRPVSVNQPWFVAGVTRRKTRNQIAKLAKRKNR